MYRLILVLIILLLLFYVLREVYFLVMNQEKKSLISHRKKEILDNEELVNSIGGYQSKIVQELDKTHEEEIESFINKETK